MHHITKAPGVAGELMHHIAGAPGVAGRINLTVTETHGISGEMRSYVAINSMNDIVLKND